MITATDDSSVGDGAFHFTQHRDDVQTWLREAGL